MNHLPENHSGAYTDDQLVNLWLSGRPTSTQTVYRPVVVEFLKALNKGLQEATVADVVAWIESLTGSPATKCRKVSTIKSLLSYAHRTGYNVFNVGLCLRVQRPTSDLHERIIEAEQVPLILDEAAAGRDRILLKFLYASGARISEACSIRFADLRGSRVTLQGKGQKTRTVLIPEAVAQELRSLRWASDTEQSPIFKSYRGRALNVRNARILVSQAAHEAGVEMSPHWFRHAHASHALDNGAPIHLVSQCLGHQNVATTSKYLHARPTDGASRYLSIPQG